MSPLQVLGPGRTLFDDTGPRGPADAMVHEVSEVENKPGVRTTASVPRAQKQGQAVYSAE